MATSYYLSHLAFFSSVSPSIWPLYIFQENSSKTKNQRQKNKEHPKPNKKKKEKKEVRGKPITMIDHRCNLSYKQQQQPSFYLLFFLFIFSFFLFFSSSSAAYSPRFFKNVTTLSFDDGYSPLFGDGNLIRSEDGKSVRLLLDRFTGSGFISTDLYQYGFFSAMIKLPADYTAGVVVAFYMSNGDVFEKTHDELDFEFLGNIRGKKWRIQTNVYGNGSVSRGREERYNLWFDPTREAHRYSILWTKKNIIFYIDNVPMREVLRSEEMGGDFPSKPMSLYATIWDASSWATSGGKYKVNYKYSPFVAEFSELVLQGCPVDPIQQVSQADCSDKDTEVETADYAVVSPSRRKTMTFFRQRYMYYSYCYDTLRYSVPPPECVIVPEEKRHFKETGRLKFGGHPRRAKRRSRVPRASMTSSSIEEESDM